MVLTPFLFTLYTSDFKHNSGFSHIQKYSEDTAVVACVQDGQEGEYCNLVEAFSDWSIKNCLLLNTTTTKEMVVDFRRLKLPCQTAFLQREAIKVNRDIQIPWCALGQQIGLVCKHKCSLCERTKLPLLLQEAEIIPVVQ